MPTVKSYRAQQAVAPLPNVQRTKLPIGQLQAPVITAQPSAESMGAQLGETVRAVGEQGFTQGLHYQDQLRQKAKQQQDRVAILEADRKLSEWENQTLYDPQQGVLNIRGKDAFGLPEAVSKGFEQTYGDLWRGLSNDDQRLAFDQLAQTRRRDVQGTVLRHVSKEMADNEAATQASYLQNSREAAAANAMDPVRVGTEIQRQRIAISSFATAHGIDAETTQRQIAETVSQTHVDVLNQMLALGQDLNAKTYFEHNKADIQGTSLPAIERNLREGSVRGEAQRVSDFIQKGGGIGMLEPGNLDPFNRPILDNDTGKVVDRYRPGMNYSTTSSMSFNFEGKEVLIPTVVNGKRLVDTNYSEKDPLNYFTPAIDHFKKTGEHLGKFDTPEHADMYAEQLHLRQARAIEGDSPRPMLQEMMDQASQIQDPEVREHAEQRIRAQASIWKQQDEEEQKANIAQAKQAIDQTVTSMENLIDTRKPVFARDVVPPAIWNNLPHASREALETYTKKYQEKPAGVETDLGSYRTLRLMAADDPQGFAKENMLNHVHQLSESDFKKMVDLQAEIRKGNMTEANKTLNGIRGNERIINGALSDVGINPHDPANLRAVDKLWESVDAQVLILEQKSGKPASDADKQQIVDDQIMNRNVNVPGSWWGLLPGGGPFFKAQKGARAVTPEDILRAEDPSLIPVPERRKIEDSLRRKHHPVTDEEVMKVYRDKALAPKP